MPDIPEKLDAQRYDKILHNALLIANLWLSVAMAAKKRIKTDAYLSCQNIQALNKATFPLVKELGSEAQSRSVNEKQMDPDLAGGTDAA